MKDKYDVDTGSGDIGTLLAPLFIIVGGVIFLLCLIFIGGKRQAEKLEKLEEAVSAYCPHCGKKLK